MAQAKKPQPDSGSLDFQSMLNFKMEDVEEPPLLPPGTYHCKVSSIRESDPTDREGNPRQWMWLDVNMQVVAPGEDVDPSEIEAFGNVAGEFLRHRFMFNQEDPNQVRKSLFRFRNFVADHLQVDDAGGQDINGLKESALNYECLANVTWRARKDAPEIFDLVVTSTAPVA